MDCRYLQNGQRVLSPDYLKVTEVAFVLFPCDCAISYGGARGTLPDFLEERFQFFSGSFSDYFDSAVRQVSYCARQTETVRFFLRKGSEIYSLHSAKDNNMNP